MKKELADLMNDQINFEIYSGHIYLNMACYCGNEGLDGFKNWMEIQYQEELAHAKKLINHLLDCGFKPEITNWDQNPVADFKSILEMAEIALHHEKIVTARFNDLMDAANEQKDYASINFLNWFIEEQIEEEANFENLIGKIKLVKDAGLYLLDQELATRVFVDPTV